jgi:hypothetical protein
VVSFTPQPLEPRGKGSRHSIDRRLGGTPQPVRTSNSLPRLVRGVTLVSNCYLADVCCTNSSATLSTALQYQPLDGSGLIIDYSDFIHCDLIAVVRIYKSEDGTDSVNCTSLLKEVHPCSIRIRFYHLAMVTTRFMALLELETYNIHEYN